MWQSIFEKKNISARERTLYFPKSAQTATGCRHNGDCTIDKACINGVCRDPCSMRAACGRNALCTVILHQVSCKCPECYVGRAHVRCKPDKECNRPPTDPEGPPSRQYEGCKKDSECASNLRCMDGVCRDGCLGHICPTADEKCMTVDHKPTCICRHKLAINAAGELSCPTSSHIPLCRSDGDCPSTQSCTHGHCKSPCQNAVCPEGKTCQVLNHEPLCVCTKSCESEASICLKDKGCPPHLACRSYKCVDPCEGLECAGGTPCLVEDHKAICKFCPPGFVVDKNYGCLKQGRTIEKGGLKGH